MYFIVINVLSIYLGNYPISELELGRAFWSKVMCGRILIFRLRTQVCTFCLISPWITEKHPVVMSVSWFLMTTMLILPYFKWYIFS